MRLVMFPSSCIVHMPVIKVKIAGCVLCSNIVPDIVEWYVLLL